MSEQRRYRLRSFLFRVFDRILRDHQRFRVERVKARMQRCGERVFISPEAFIWSESEISIGNDVAIHAFTHIFGGGGVAIGDGTMISALCSIATVTHPVDGDNRYGLELIKKPVVIGRNVWLGTGAIVLPGVTIGDHAVVGAGAVVTRDVPAGAVVVGNPAQVTRQVNI